MGLLEKIADVVENIKQDKKENSGLLDGLVDTFKKTGIGSTIETIKEKGLGDALSSWISNDENKPITKDDINDIFDGKTLKKFSSDSGLSIDDVKDRLSKLLPDIINKSTPKGIIEDDD